MSNTPILDVGMAKSAAPEGLKDGGHVYIDCSNCNAFLMDIWRTRPHEKDVWKVQAICPFCGDKSFIQDIPGGFNYGGYGTIRKDNEDDDIPSTIVEDGTFVGDVYVFTVKKANKDVKPVYNR